MSEPWRAPAQARLAWLPSCAAYVRKGAGKRVTRSPLPGLLEAGVKRNTTKEDAMAKVSKESATQGGDYGPVEDHSEEVDGYTVGFTTFRQDFDTTPLLKGLPDDRCQCPHWGYVIKGRITFDLDGAEE